ncbi:CBO0543 family protein [Paenibacillus sp. GCM10027628]|uniref:CBO0543 family protein n=1 Tax=Paenibacillus sp. GCM10027628 TaxID=3273413 RepID=UPI00362A8E12
MNTVKHWNDSRLLRSPKKRLTFWNKDSLTCAMLASLLGTYSDLYFVGKGLYQFPHRLLPEIFSINIIFTLIGLPVLTMVFLYFLSQMNRWGKTGMILFVSLLIPILEKLAERLGVFLHSDKWIHLYSFFGYLLFLTLISGIHFWLKKESV